MVSKSVRTFFSHQEIFEGAPVLPCSGRTKNIGVVHSFIILRVQIIRYENISGLGSSKRQFSMDKRWSFFSVYLTYVKRYWILEIILPLGDGRLYCTPSFHKKGTFTNNGQLSVLKLPKNFKDVTFFIFVSAK